MDFDFVKKVILLPVITGVLLSAVAVLCFSNAVNSVMPFNRDAQLANHEALALPQDSAADSIQNAADNEPIGATAEGMLMVKNADYTLMTDCISVDPSSSEWTASGCRYLKILNSRAADFGTELTVTLSDGTQKYFRFTEEYDVDNETQALAVAPFDGSSVVIYYQNTEGVGLSDNYHLMIYGEVA
ncbi:MAG: hypothetical protein IJ168_00265 [Eubacterium sp.]|nr:hypothetical protein [Eubacterium sp.]